MAPSYILRDLATRVYCGFCILGAVTLHIWGSVVYKSYFSGYILPFLLRRSDIVNVLYCNYVYVLFKPHFCVNLYYFLWRSNKHLIWLIQYFVMYFVPMNAFNFNRFFTSGRHRWGLVYPSNRPWIFERPVQKQCFIFITFSNLLSELIRIFG